MHCQFDCFQSLKIRSNFRAKFSGILKPYQSTRRQENTRFMFQNPNVKEHPSLLTNKTERYGHVGMHVGVSPVQTRHSLGQPGGTRQGDRAQFTGRHH